MVESFQATLSFFSTFALLVGLFLITNSVVWALSTWYPHTAGGLLACLAAGLPFYRYMLAGDIVAGIAMYKLPQVAAALALRRYLGKHSFRPASQ